MTRGRVGQKDEEGGGGDDTRTFWMTFPEKAGPRPCPVEGCGGQAASQIAMRVYFWNRYVLETVVILEEGNLPHPRFPLCDMLVPFKALNRMHRRTSQCTRGAERKIRRLATD